MKQFIAPGFCFGFCKMAGFCLLFAFWVKSGQITGFFLLLFLIVMSLLRWRIPRLNFTVLIDFAVCAVLSVKWNEAAIILPTFEAVYLGYYWFSFSTVYALYKSNLPFAAIWSLAAVCAYFLNRWECECKQRRKLRDAEAGRYYELESLQGDLVAALAQIEQMTAVAERARIARDIHDNAGHEIIAAYMSFQALRNMIALDDPEIAGLYDAALERLDTGTSKIREAVHNLSTVTFLGVQRLHEKCRNFSACEIDFKVYGDTSCVPIYIWSMLESCLSEALTNILRHSSASKVTAELDATPYIVRLCITNDGVLHTSKPPGNGLRNLRHRAAAIGGSLSVDAGELFSVICVIPIRI